MGLGPPAGRVASAGPGGPPLDPTSTAWLRPRSSLSPILLGSALQVYPAGPKGPTPARKSPPTSGLQLIALWSLVDLEAFPLEWEWDWHWAHSVFKMCWLTSNAGTRQS